MIPFNDFRRQWADIRTHMTAALEAVGESGWYILGNEVREFEAALASTWGVAHAVGVASGLDAIEIALRALGCQAGDKVLTTPISAFATTLAILKIGALPVFVDCDECGLIDLAWARRALEKDSSIRFFVPVHLYGHSLDLDELQRLRDDFDLRIVEDCAQSILASFNRRMTGTVGQLAATSFYPTKNLGAMGDGGAILTNDSAHADTARILRDYGQTGKYQHAAVGYNSRLDELQAAFLRRVFLPRLPAWTTRRRDIATKYIAEISHPRIRLPLPLERDCSVWHLFPVCVDPALKLLLQSHLRVSGVASAEHYPTAIVDQPAMPGVPYEIIGRCDTARRFCASEVSLPIHPYLTDDEVARIVDACISWPE